MKRLHHILPLITLLFLPCFSSVTKAQFGWDMAGVEAFIDDHKGERSVLTVRTVVEQGNKVLHSTSDNTNEKFKNMNDEIDKYTKAFDVIDVVFNTVSTGFNIYHTVDNVSNKIGKYKDMLDAYNQKILSRGRIEPADTMLISINKQAIENIYNECDEIYKSCTAIAMYSTGQFLANTSSINLQIKRIDQCLTRIQRIVNRAHFETYTFIQSRIRMWNRRIFVEKSRLTICNERFAEWKERSKNVKPK